MNKTMCQRSEEL